MAAGRDVGIDPDGHGGADAHRLGDAVDKMQFRLGFDVDLGDAGFQGEGDLALGLADPGEHDPIRRNPGGQRPAQLALGDHVGAGAQDGQGAQDRDIGIGLDREGDQRIDQPRAGERVAQHGVVPLQGGGRIDIDRRSDGPGDAG